MVIVLLNILIILGKIVLINVVMLGVVLWLIKDEVIFLICKSYSLWDLGFFLVKFLMIVLIDVFESFFCFCNKYVLVLVMVVVLVVRVVLLFFLMVIVMVVVVIVLVFLFDSVIVCSILVCSSLWLGEVNLLFLRGVVILLMM